MYLLDTNVFISAKNFYYGFDFHPGFWDWLTHANREGRVFSTKKVYDEICQQEDQLNRWASAHKDGIFLGPPKDFDDQLECITDYVIDGNFKPSAIEEFLKAADYYLIAHALAKHFKIVTHEVPKSRKGKIKIPQVCQEFAVECLTPFDMLRRENARFVWKPDNG